MKKIQVIVWILGAAMILQSCQKLVGEGPVVNETRTTPNFAGVQLKVPGHLIYAEGAAYKVELQSQQNILNEVETTMSGNDLIIRFRHANTNLRSGEDINVKITAPALTKLEVHGSGNIDTQTSFDPATLRLAVSGSGNIRIYDVTTSTIDAEISGSGKISVTDGGAENQSLKISGSGDMDFGNFVAKQTSIRISGSGGIKVNVEEILDVNIAGSGSVRYRGNPVVTSSISGSGSVTKW